MKKNDGHGGGKRRYGGEAVHESHCVVNKMTIGDTLVVVLWLRPSFWPAPFGFPTTWIWSGNGHIVSEPMLARTERERMTTFRNEWNHWSTFVKHVATDHPLCGCVGMIILHSGVRNRFRHTECLVYNRCVFCRSDEATPRSDTAITDNRSPPLTVWSTER